MSSVLAWLLSLLGWHRCYDANGLACIVRPDAVSNLTEDDQPQGD